MRIRVACKRVDKMFNRREDQTGEGGRREPNASSEVAEAIPIVHVHIDEELLTRQRYLKEGLEKQEAELRKSRDAEEQRVREAGRGQLDKLHDEHERRLKGFRQDIAARQEAEDSARRIKESKLMKELSNAKEAHSKMKTELAMEHASRIEARKVAEDLALLSSNERSSISAKEAARQREELDTLIQSAKRDAEEERAKHEQRLEQISVDAKTTWRQFKPVLVMSMLGGALGLMLSPET